MKKQKIKLFADGIHDDTASLQALLDKKGTINIPDGMYLIKKPLIIHDDTHLILSKNTVFYLADGANCSLLDNDGLYLKKTNRNITVEGGIWFGNHSMQTRESIDDENQPCDYDKYVSNTLIVLMLRFVHVENLILKNLTFKDPTSFAVHIADVKYFNVENIHLDYDLKKPNMDGIHIQGPARFGQIKNIYGNANDDHIALCANGTTRSEITKGVIEDIDIDGVYCDNGYTGVRLLSCGDAVKNISIKNIHGQFRYFAVSFTHHYPLKENTLASFENINVNGLFISKNQEELYVSYQNGSLIYFEHGIKCKNVNIQNVYCKSDDLSLVKVGDNAELENVNLNKTKLNSTKK